MPSDARRVSRKPKAKPDPWADHGVTCAVAAAERYLGMGAAAMAVAVARSAIDTYSGHREGELQSLAHRGLEALGYVSAPNPHELRFIRNAQVHTFWAEPGEEIRCGVAPSGIRVRIGLPGSGFCERVLKPGERVTVQETSHVTVDALGLSKLSSSYSRWSAA